MSLSHFSKVWGLKKKRKSLPILSGPMKFLYEPVIFFFLKSEPVNDFIKSYLCCVHFIICSLVAVNCAFSMCLFCVVSFSYLLLSIWTL